MSDRKRWANDPAAGPVWPPADHGGQAQLVRVERHEVIETVGTAEQIHRSGVFGQHGAPGHPGQGVHEVYEPAGELPAGGGGFLMNAFQIALEIERGFVSLVQLIFTFCSRHPRLVLYVGGLWVLSLVAS